MGWERKGPHVLGGQRVARAIDQDAMPRDIATALRRARKMDRAALLDWAEGSLATIGRNISDYRRDGVLGGDFLRAAQSDAAVLYAVLSAAVETLSTPPVAPRPSADLGAAAVRQG